MEDSKKYCGILPYFVSVSYLCWRKPVGLTISPVIWHLYNNAISDCVQSQKCCGAIMDDFVIVYTRQEIS